MAKEPAKKDEKKGARSLYDNPRSGGEQTVRDREDEAAGTAKADAEASMASAEGGEDRGMGQAIEGVTMAIKGLKALHEAHKRERDDFHGNMSQGMADMAKRHEEQFQNLMKELGAGPENKTAEA